MKELSSQWVEMVVTVVSALGGSLGLNVYWKKRADKEMDVQRVEDGLLKDQIHALALEVKTSALNSNTEAMNSMARSLELFAKSNDKKDIILETLKESLNTAHIRIDKAQDEIKDVKEKYVSHIHFNAICGNKHKV